MPPQTSNQAIDVGTVLANSYEVTQKIGEGGMGAVWAARHLRLEGKRVAIKVLHGEVASDSDSVARFRREAQIASRLGHPNIVQVHDINELPDGTSYLVLEYLKGESLADRLARGPMPAEQTLAIVRQVGSALAAAHAQHIIHRDLKPQNVFLCPTESAGYATEQAKVLDFGISKIKGSQTIETRTTSMLGTPQYMAPEQAMGHHHLVDGRTDVFALGVMIYEMLSGTAPFQGTTIPEVVFKVVYEDPPSLAELVPDLDARLVAAVHRAMAKNQQDRFATVSDFVEALTGDPLTTLRDGVAASPLPHKPLPPSVDTGVARLSHAGDAYAPGVTPGGPLPAVTPGAVDTAAMPIGPGADRARSDQLAMSSAPTPGVDNRAGQAPAPPRSALAPSEVSAHPPSGVPGWPSPSHQKPPTGRSRRWTPILVLAGAAAAGASFAVIKTMSSSDGEHPPAAQTSTDPGQNGVDPTVQSSGQAGDAGQAAPGTSNTPVTGTNPSGDKASSDGDKASGDATAKTPTRPGQDQTGDNSTKTRPGTPMAPSSQNKLPPNVARTLKKAERALRADDPGRAIILAKRTLGSGPVEQAYDILTRAYCMKRDLRLAKAQAQHLRHRTLKRASKFCRKYDIELR
ncbi:MAG: protein kinase [Proteobacteria bacterium]|nr:protein kinase [Pseudomonadota bacterium]